MSTPEILEELSRLKAEERSQIFQKLCELQENDLLKGVGPTPEETAILDHALKQFEKDGDRGIQWRVALAQVRRTATT